MRLRKQVELAELYMREFTSSRSRGESIYAHERLAQLLIQSILDLGAMIAVSLKEAKPGTYRGIARYMAEKLRLTPHDRVFLESLAGFRNLLVHGYASIDRELEEKALSELERQVPAILKRLKKFVETLGDDPVDEWGKLAPVFRKHRVRYAFLFGSRARQGSGRDYDIAVSAPMASALELGKLLVDLAEALGVGEEEVDLALVENAPGHLIHTIALEGLLIYGDPDEAYSDLLKRYLEYLDVNVSYARTPSPS